MNACVIATYRCNAHCHMCDIWRNPTKKSEEITPDVVAKMPGNLGRINLTGGEPMLRDDIEELVRILYKKCRIVEISTNGFYTDRLVRIAEKYPKVMIRISLEGLPALNDRLRGITNGFDHALRSILELKKTKVKDIGFSIVICDKNVKDLVSLYNLAVGLNVELAQSTMHNSWYFHKTDNKVDDKQIVLCEMERFMTELLTSKRSSLRLKIKDWLRAFFNLRIYHYIKYGYSHQRTCTADTDLFFLDPFGDILPCNGTDDKWVMGNLNEKTFKEIWTSPQAEKVREMVKSCRRDCAFIGTARFDMLRNPARPIKWILKNKIRFMQGKPICVDLGEGDTIVDNIDTIPVLEREKSKKLVIK